MWIAIVGFVLFALLVAIGIIIALAMYFTKKGKKSKTEDDDDETSEDTKKTELTFDTDATKTINPQEEDNGNIILKNMM
jgi:flagellar biosynthesis/type III secretory pathway M-ring protein FliF/YscJ